MKKLAVFVLYLLLPAILTGCASQKTGSGHDITPLQQFADGRFAEYLESLDIADYEITSRSYASRGGGADQYVCLYEAELMHPDEDEETIKYGYFIVLNDKNTYVIRQEGADVTEAMLSVQDTSGISDAGE